MRFHDARPNGVWKYVLLALGRTTWLCLASCQTILWKLANELLLTGKRSCGSLHIQTFCHFSHFCPRHLQVASTRLGYWAWIRDKKEGGESLLASFFVSTSVTSDGMRNYFPWCSSETVNFLRPLARREANTRRPFLVAILSRKPCLFTLLLLCGWNVLFIAIKYLIFCYFRSFGVQKYS